MKPIVAALFGVLLCLAAAPCVAADAELPQVGQAVTDAVALFGKRIPLPPGDWRVTAVSVSRVTGGDPGPYGTIGGVLLMRPADDPQHAFVVVRTNAVPVHGGWGPPADCVEGAALWQSVAEPHDLHNACAFVESARAGRIAAWMGDPSLVGRLPRWALVAGFRASDRNDVVEARYGIVPASKAQQAAWAGSWHSLDPSQKALLERIGDWARQARQVSLAALRQPAEQVPPVPSLGLATAPAAATSGSEVTALRAGLYDVATDSGVPATAWNWALASTLAGNLYVGATIAAWQSLTHNAIYFGNEMAWEWPHDVAAMNFVAARPMPRGGATEPAPGADRGFTLNGKQVPLPAGTWTVLARDTSATAAGAVLGWLDGSTLRGLVVVHANPTRTAAIFGTAGDCSRSDMFFSAIRYDTALDGYCDYAKPVAPEEAAAGTDSLWTMARVRLLAANVDMPPLFLEVGARARTHENFVDVRYYFPPDAELAAAGLTGAQLGAARAADSPVLLERIVALQAWADLVQLPLEQGVRGRLPSAMSVLPWPWQNAGMREALASQARAPLESLHEIGAIDDAELKHQLALADVTLAEREQRRGSLGPRSSYKVATYRALSYVDSLAVSWLITLSPQQSLAFATINAVAQPFMTYIGDFGWSGSDGSKAAALRPVDFPELGRDRL